MPVFKIETNIPDSKIPSDFLKTTSALVAKTLGKPETYVIVQVVPNQKLTFGGTTDPAACCMLMSIGKLGTVENKKHAKVLFEHIEKNLGIPTDRFYITFVDESTANVGYKGTTFHELFG